MKQILSKFSNLILFTQIIFFPYEIAASKVLDLVMMDMTNEKANIILENHTQPFTSSNICHVQRTNQKCKKSSIFGDSRHIKLNQRRAHR